MEMTRDRAGPKTSGARVCEKCGAKIFADASSEFCGACFLETGLNLLEDGDPAQPREPILAEFGDYELLEEIGRGGQGVVYRARQKSLNRMVALKVIGLGHWATEIHLKRFRREAEAAASLEHPRIVPIYEIGELDGACYFSMKLEEGGQLDQLASSAVISLRRATEIIASLARTVQYAHERGILHRDIKPGNILLDAEGEPHLADFGLARLVETESTVTRTMEVLGTPSYIAPEQARGESTQLTSATDVYGLGAVFYQLLTGHPPFAGGTTYETIRLVLETEPRNPRLWNPKIDRDLTTICLKCLEKDPQRRYPSALALAEDLERWLRHEPIQARRTGILTRGRKWIRRNPTMAMLLPLLVALLMAVGALYWNRAPEPPPAGIAVLPFENLDGGKEDAMFADGIQDDILTKLAKIADLKVISRTSVMHYRGAQNARQIGQALHVSHVLEGSVRRDGGRIRLNIQLIDTRTDQHVWAEAYDRGLTDIFAVQTEIAQEIADQLRARISPREKTAIGEQPTTDLKAYGLYTEARTISSWDDWEGAKNAMARKVKFLEEATQRDPKFVLAWCALAKVQDDLFTRTGDPNDLDLAKKAVETALQLRPDLGEPHRELARYYLYRSEYDRAYDELTIARRTLPNDPEALFIAGRMDRHINRWDASLANLQKAHELDPRNEEIAYHLVQNYRSLRRYDLWKQDLEKDVVGESLGAWAQLALAELKLDIGDPAGARAVLAQLPQSWSPTYEVWETRLFTSLCLRDYDAASRVLTAIPEKFDDDSPLLRGRPGIWVSAMIARYRGDELKVKTILTGAREQLDADLGDQQQDEGYFLQASRFDAGLGRNEEAIREAKRAVDLLPITEDALTGILPLTNLALVYAWTGEREPAIEQLENLAKAPGGPSYGDLLLNPCWDSLRGDARFEKIVASLAPQAIAAR
jgi:TolB-like protein/Tfp pilus assembly protein PilF/predicted Ser/Thr protein kinase